MIGQTISHYKIIEKIGQGGMGEVYRAEDTHLERDVALKFLPEGLQQDSTARKRFLREAKSAAALDHPYICKIYEVGEEKGQSFISMEYIAGQTLSQKLTEGPLPLKNALQMAIEIAEALNTAHRKEIVHRDLKPSNIMLTSDGHVKVTDFGLAKRVTPPEGQEPDITTALTREGSTLGTIPYMSPEQLKGEPVDARSDIFSFGVVLYEMLAGVNPFSKGGHMETAKAVLGDTAPPLTRYSEDIPVLLQHTIKKMMAKEPDQRYQLVHDVRTDLGELSVTSGESEISEDTPAAIPALRSYFWPVVAGGVMVLVLLALAWFWPFTPSTPGEAIDSIAILLFENQSGDPEINYLSEGIAGEVTYSLSQLSNLRVMPTSAVVRYKGQEITPQRVASDLKVRAVVTGTATQQGENLSLRVELVDTQEDRLLWGQQYTRKSTDVLALQEEIAQDISENLRLQLSGAEQEQLRKRYTTHPEAHQDYLQGRFHARTRLPEDLEKAVEYFNSAIDKDPRYALAYAGLADAYYAQAIYSGRSVEEFYEREVSAAQRALELDDTLSDAHAVMGGITAMHGWNWATGEEHLTRALELNPNDVRAYQMRAGLFWRQRRWDEALEGYRTAQLLDPLSAGHLSSIARVHRSMHEFDEAIELLKEVVELRPNRAPGHSHLAWTYWYNGMFEEAIAQAEKWAPLPKLMPREPKLPLFFRQMASGNRVEAINTLENWQGLSAYYRAEYYALLGEKEKALEWLSKIVEERHHGAVGANINPAWDPLRDDPRFQDLLRRMNLEP